MSDPETITDPARTRWDPARTRWDPARTRWDSAPLLPPKETACEKKLSMVLEETFSHLLLALNPERAADIQDQRLLRAFRTCLSVCQEAEANGGDDAQLLKNAKTSYKNLVQSFRNSPKDLGRFRQGLEPGVGDETEFYESMREAVLGVRERAKREPTETQTPQKTKELEQAIASTSKQTRSSQDQILDLQSRLEELRNPLPPEAPLTDEEMKASATTEDTPGLRTDLVRITGQRDQAYVQDRARERAVQEETEAAEESTSKMIQDFDVDMDKLQRDLELSVMKLQQMEEQRTALEEVFPCLKNEYEAVMSKRLQEEQRRKEERAKTAAAVRIQAWWRRERVHRALRRKTAEKKKSPKKGKKKRVL